MLCALALIAGASASADAQSKGKGKGGGAAPSQSKEFFESIGQIAVGLVPVYPASALCPEISSPFGALTRYDGSPRANDHFGFHNGMDITAKEGTPLIAIASGQVVHSGAGGPLVGNFVWLRHTPEDTGLPVHLYSRYQHLDQPSKLANGARLTVGEYVGPAGKTGTVGPHYGPAGYSHLHLLILASDDAEYEVQGAVVQPANRRFLDPLAIYIAKAATFDNRFLRDLPEAEKRVAIPYQTMDGAREPAGAKLVWPLACRKI
jgi:murein DD-endopeptidase MepM/ murein hydrolase activator NlpD